MQLSGQEINIQHCRFCGQRRSTTPVQYQRNVGMLYARRLYTVSGDMCRTCVHKKFWQFESLNLVLGPWGMISLIYTPVLLVTNAVEYGKALYKLRGTPE